MAPGKRGYVGLGSVGLAVFELQPEFDGTVSSHSAGVVSSSAGGGGHRPGRRVLEPRNSTEPSLLTAQIWRVPALTKVNSPTEQPPPAASIALLADISLRVASCVYIAVAEPTLMETGVAELMVAAGLRVVCYQVRRCHRIR